MIQIRDSYLKHIICSCILLLISVYSSASEVIRTSSILKWTPSSLSKIVESCSEGDVIIFDADYDYTIDRCISPKVSITIEGCGKTLRTINRYNYVISLFNVEGTNSFRINNLIIDGSYNTSNADKTVPKEFFITVKNVKEVSFTNCTFQNIRTDYPNWKTGDEAYTIWIDNYDKFAFTDNIVKNVYCPEFLKAVLPITNNDKKRIANISRNKMSFVSTSSAIEVRFGRFRINNNEIGVTRGSTINAFGFDSEIIGNVFHGSHNSSSIDLSEQYAFNYKSKNILIKNNYSEYSHEGLVMGDHVENIKVINNIFRADKYNEEDFARYDRGWSFVERSCDRALTFDHDISDIHIISNSFVGVHALLMLNQLGYKKDIKIENNEIRNVSKPKRSCIIITQVDGLSIKNNRFVNTGRSLSYLDSPQFIVIGPTKEKDPEKRFVRNMKIERNTFSFNSDTQKKAYILAHTIYDKADCNTLSTLSSIVIKKNKTNIIGNVLLVSNDFETIPKDRKIKIKNNNFGTGSVSGNIIDTVPVVNRISGENVVANTVIEKDGKRYFVIIGGNPSERILKNNENEFVLDGGSVLKRIK